MQQVEVGAGGIQPRRIVVHRTRADRIYRRIAQGGGLLTFVILTFIGLFLFIQALPALKQGGVLRFLTQFEWGVDADVGIAAVLFGTVVIALIALTIAVPLAILTALFITEFAPPKLRKWLTSMVDLMAAVPSIIYGLWGFFFLQPRLLGVSHWLTTYLGFIPIFKTNTTNLAGSPFMAGCVVALMVVPIATSVMREVFSRTPPAEKEGALALGGTRWGMIKTVVLPFGRGGIVGGSMLGLGRALGETIAVAIIINAAFFVTPRVLESGANSIAALIALRFGEATDVGRSALIAAGLVLFMVTLVVNMIASVIVSRSRTGAEVEI